MTEKQLNLQKFIPYRLSITSNAVSARIAHEYQSRFGLKIPEWRLMAVLGNGREMTQRDLVAATLMDKVTVNRSAKTLFERRLIKRQAHAIDRRSHHLKLSALGQTLYEEIAVAAMAIEEELLSELNAEERTQLIALLDRLAEAAAMTAL